MPKIAILCTPKDIHACKWAEALHQAGIEVLFICPAPEVVSLPFCRVIPIECRSKEKWSYGDFWFSANSLRIVLDLEKPHLVCALHVTPFGVWALRSGYRPFVLMALGSDILEYTPARPRPRAWDTENNKSLFRRWFNFFWHKFQVKKTLLHSDSIWADNDTLVAGINALVPQAHSKTRRFSWGIDIAQWPQLPDAEKNTLREKLNLPVHRRIILCPRGLKPVYQPELILEAIQASIENPDFFWIVLKGNYEIPQDILHAFQSQNLPNCLFITETLAQDDIQDYFAASDLLVSIPVYDGLSASVLQAFAAGLHPVLSDIPASQELRNSGLQISVVKGATGNNLLNNIVSWYSDNTEYDREIGRKNNRTWVEENAAIQSQVHWFLQQMGLSG